MLNVDSMGQMELRDCDGTNDWRLNCPNNCSTIDDSLRHFIASPANDRIAVWGNHTAIWTGAGRDGLKLLVTCLFHVPPVCSACSHHEYKYSAININKNLSSCQDICYGRPMVSSLNFRFFLAYSQPSQIGCLPYFHTWCGLSANLGCRSETTRGSLKIQNATNRQKFAI